MASKLKSLLGLAGEEAPKAGHWMTTMREASQLPATQPTVNESVVNEMLNRPVDRRTFMEGTKNAATALSMGNKLGALADLVPEAATPVQAAMPASEYLSSFLSNLSPRRVKLLEEEMDATPELVIDHVSRSPLLKDLQLKNSDPKLAADELADHIMKQLGPAEGRHELPFDQAVKQGELAEDADILFNLLDAAGLRGKKHRRMPDLFDYFNTIVE